MSEESNKIASNTLVQIIGRAIVLVLSLISIKLITNYLGPQGTGYYNTVITFFSFAIVIADFGLFSVIVREVSKRPDESKKLFANVFTLRFLSAIFVTLAAIIIAYTTGYPMEIKRGILLASLFPIFNLIGSVYDMYFQHKLDMHKVVYSEVISKLLTVTLIFLIAKYNIGYYAVIFTVSISALLIFLVKAYLSKNKLPLVFGYDKSLIKEIIKMSLPLGIVFIVNNIYFKIDTLLLFYYKGAIDVGIYAVAYRVLETTLFAGSYLSSSLKPLLSTSVENNPEKAKKAISTGALYLIWMGLSITIVCLVFPKEIIMFLSNSEFIAGSRALVLLGFASCLIYAGGLFGEILIAKDLRKIMIILSSSILVVNIGLNIFLIPRYSYTGAASATLLSEIILLVSTYLITRKVIKIEFDLIKIVKLILIAFLSSLIGFYLKRFEFYFLFNIAIIMAFYFSLSYYFKAIPSENLNNYIGSFKSKWKN